MDGCSNVVVDEEEKLEEKEFEREGYRREEQGCA